MCQVEFRRRFIGPSLLEAPLRDRSLQVVACGFRADQSFLERGELGPQRFDLLVVVFA